MRRIQAAAMIEKAKGHKTLEYKGVTFSVYRTGSRTPTVDCSVRGDHGPGLSVAKLAAATGPVLYHRPSASYLIAFGKIHALNH